MGFSLPSALHLQEPKQYLCPFPLPIYSLVSFRHWDTPCLLWCLSLAWCMWALCCQEAPKHRVPLILFLLPTLHEHPVTTLKSRALSTQGSMTPVIPQPCDSAGICNSSCSPNCAVNLIEQRGKHTWKINRSALMCLGPTLKSIPQILLRN